MMSPMSEPFIVEGGSCREDPVVCRNHQQGIVIAMSQSERSLREVGSIRAELVEVKGIVVEIRDRLHSGDLAFQALRKDVDDATKWQQGHDVDRRERKTRWEKFADGVKQPIVVAFLMGAWGLAVAIIPKLICP